MKRRFSLFLAILMLVSVFSPLGLGFEGNEIRFSTNVVEAAEDDAQSNEGTPKEEVNDASNEVTPKEVNDASSEATPKEEDNNASEEVTPDVDNGTSSTDEEVKLTNDILTIGKDGTERNFTWYANTKEKGKFEFAKLNAEKDFKDATVLDATVKETNKDGFSSNQVTLDGLEPDTEYMYRFSNGDTVSEVKTFKTGGTGDFSFFAAGDPQIGAGFEDEDEKGWDKTLKLLPELDPSASFLLSLGDQVNISDNERQYDAYINRDGFNGLTLAPIIGNHDSGNHAYTEHFKLSNVQEEGKTTAGSNYYYVYNNTLFICLNSNNRNYAEHKSTIKKAIAENPNVKWKVVAFHHPPYTVASHALDGYISNMRSTLVPILKENKIDLVLNGHDHVYTRTHVMDGTKPIIEWENGEEGKAPNEYVNPKGIIYVTTNSASGSKHYDIMKNQNFEFSAFKNQEYVPNISNLKITDNSIEVTTYRTNDSSVVDSFKIIKGDPTPVKPSEVRVTFKVDENKGKFVPNEDGVILNTRVLPMNFDATKLEKMAPEVEGLDGYEFKGWDKEFVGELDQDLIINAIFEKVEKTEPEAGSIQTNAILTIGKDGTERNFTWYANTKEKGKFEFAKLNAEKDFKDATVLDATVKETNKDGFSSNQVTLDGLEPDTEYMYRFSNGDTVSEVKTFKTGGTGDFSFFAAGDPQIGSGGPLNGKEGWDKTLNLLPELDSSASFLLSLGDQVQAGKDEEEYDAYINREGFNGLTLAPIIGNHDDRGNAHEEHFKVSNVQNEGKSNAGSNYYYVYNNTLFICLNSNNKDYGEHKVTIEKAIAENPNVKWRVVTFHHPPYTVARHALDKYITDMRSTLVPILKENKIDLVLNGHDHVYTRTHVMDGTKPIIEWENGEEGKAPNEYVNPKGIIYVTTNSASGSKFYDIMQDKKFEYSAVKNQEKVPNISNVKVTDNSIEVTTYRTSDKSIVDSFKIVKEDPTPVKPSEVRVTFKIDENKGKFLPNEDGVILNTRVLPMNFDATKLEKMAPEVEGLEGYKFKGWDKEFVGELDQDLTINAIFEKVEKTEPEEDNSVEPTKPTPTQPEKDDTREEPIRLFPRHHDRTETHPVYVSKSSIFTKEDALKKGKEIANKNLAKNSGKATDIDGHWAKDSINYALENNLIDLIGNEFKPNKNATRYTVVKALGRFKKIDVEKYKGKSLKDVDANSEESAYVNWAIENGIIAGYEDNTFGGDREITREEIARILNLFAEKSDIKVKNLEAPKFKDQNKISDWASKDIKEATEKGLLVGRDDGTFGPKDNLTRAEVAQMIVNMIK